MADLSSLKDLGVAAAAPAASAPVHVKKVDAQTRAKTSLNDLLRD